MTALILAGGALVPTPALRAVAQKSQLVIAADAGLRHAELLGVTPEVLVGDFDSVTPGLLAAYPALPTQRYPTDKDQLDLELAIDYALARGATRFCLAGVLGDRLDQLLAALFIAARLRQAGYPVSLHGDRQDAYILQGERLQLELAPQTLFSVLSLTPEATLSITGARYPLARATVSYGTGLGVSNRVVAAPLTVAVHSGQIALVIERDQHE